MLRWRIILGVVFIAGFTALCWLDVRASRPGMFLTPLALIAAFLGAGEMLRMFQARGEEAVPWTLYVGALAPVAASGAAVIWYDSDAVTDVGRLGWLALGLIVGLVIAFLGGFQRDEPAERSMAGVSQATLTVLYVGGLIGMLLQMRLVDDPKPLAATLLPLLSMIAIVKLSDTAQYFVGRLMGRQKLAPRTSPGKTWEGAVGGIAVATVIAAVLLPWVASGVAEIDPVRMLAAGGYGLSIAIAGLFGDLAESLIKRAMGLKDSSSWLPGFGGILDLLDSLMFAAPVAYAWWATEAL